MFRLSCGFIRLCVKENDFKNLYKTFEELDSGGQMVGWGKGSEQSALRKDLYYSQGEKEEKRYRRALQEE